MRQIDKVKMIMAGLVVLLCILTLAGPVRVVQASDPDTIFFTCDFECREHGGSQGLCAGTFFSDQSYCQQLSAWDHCVSGCMSDRCQFENSCQPDFYCNAACQDFMAYVCSW